MVLQLKQTQGTIEQNGSSEIYPHTEGQLIFNSGVKNTQSGKDGLFNNGAGKTDFHM